MAAHQKSTLTAKAFRRRREAVDPLAEWLATMLRVSEDAGKQVYGVEKKGPTTRVLFRNDAHEQVEKLNSKQRRQLKRKEEKAALKADEAAKAKLAAEQAESCLGPHRAAADEASNAINALASVRPSGAPSASPLPSTTTWASVGDVTAPQTASPPKPPPPAKPPPSPPPQAAAASATSVVDVAMGGQMGVQPVKRTEADPAATAAGASDDGFRSPPRKKTAPARELFKESPPPKSTIYPHDPRHVKAAWRKVLKEWDGFMHGADDCPPHVRVGRTDVHFIRHGALEWAKRDAGTFWTQDVPSSVAEGYGNPRPSKVNMKEYVAAYEALRTNGMQFERVGESDIFITSHYLLDKFYGMYDAFWRAEWYDLEMR